MQRGLPRESFEQIMRLMDSALGARRNPAGPDLILRKPSAAACRPESARRAGGVVVASERTGRARPARRHDVGTQPPPRGRWRSMYPPRCHATETFHSAASHTTIRRVPQTVRVVRSGRLWIRPLFLTVLYMPLLALHLKEAGDAAHAHQLVQRATRRRAGLGRAQRAPRKGGFFFIRPR